MQSSIFFNEPTVVDHSYIGPDGCIYGGSINPSFIVTGNVDDQEHVVLDFSAGKKQLKNAVDAEDGGFDHKCWIIPGYSSVLSICREDETRILDWTELYDPQDGNQLLTVVTPQIIIRAPKNAFKFFKWQSFDFPSTVQTEMSDYLKACLPSFDFSVAVHEKPALWNDRPHSMFRYVHGLKDSSSWGCQNIAHGHLSFLQVVAQAGDEEIQDALDSIARDLDNTVFVNAANFTRDDYFRTIEYKSGRGTFLMAFHSTSAHKLTVLETETTIEHIIEFVAAKYKTLLKSIGASVLFVSEGLSKGAAISLTYEEQE